MDSAATFILAVLGSNAVVILVTALINRRREQANVLKTLAETEHIASTTRQTETTYYQNLVEETIAQMRILEAKVKELKAAIELAQTQYEQRVGTLHTKIDSLVTALDRANAALDTANNTIAQLRQEVKDGNSIITELRKEITKLLVNQAEKS